VLVEVGREHWQSSLLSVTVVILVIGVAVAVVLALPIKRILGPHFVALQPQRRNCTTEYGGPYLPRCTDPFRLLCDPLANPVLCAVQSECRSQKAVPTCTPSSRLYHLAPSPSTPPSSLTYAQYL
jgi:hypothetical protein